MKILFAALMFSVCSSGGVHSKREKTADGGTTLTAGPFDWTCAARLDGARVAQGVAMPVKPGTHVVSCDAESLEVTVARGDAVTVEYFGP